jgi:hypothetical protein
MTKIQKLATKCRLQKNFGQELISTENAFVLCSVFAPKAKLTPAELQFTGNRLKAQRRKILTALAL